jgi:type I restriction enzyme, S subunit
MSRITKQYWPPKWDVKTLDEICDLQIGRTPSRSNQAYWTNGTYTWVTIADMASRVISSSKEQVTDKAIEDNRVVLIPKGSLLMSFKLTIGKLAFAGKDLFTNEAIVALNLKPQYQAMIEPDYLYWVLQAVPLEKDAIFAVKGRTLNTDKLKRIEMPIPELTEQRRIVARIEALLAEVREMRALHDEIAADGNRLMGACIQEVFGQQNGRWQTDQLSEVALIQTGAAKGGRYGDKQLIDVPYLRVANVQAGFLDLAEIKTLSIPEEKIDRYRLEVGDLLLTEGGDYDKLGRGAIWEGQIENCIHQNHVFAVRFDQQRVLSKFAEYEMQSRYAKDYFLRVAKKTTNLASINKTQLGNFPIRYPAELAEQERIINYLDVVLAEVAEMQKSQNEDGGFLDKLEQAILNQAFRGEL